MGGTGSNALAVTVKADFEKFRLVVSAAMASATSAIRITWAQSVSQNPKGMLGYMMVYAMKFGILSIYINNLILQTLPVGVTTQLLLGFFISA
ncbi:hypothetical protein [Sphingobium sp. Sx8-8]|uniref:hypothetical protein n=1 Tax=Sphingobium sp. Sx8-8 TaxID=2933617 RepID=UPI001F599E5C|nr:hypothetical protein [Sphingobium sp. Sx8-8]